MCTQYAHTAHIAPIIQRIFQMLSFVLKNECFTAKSRAAPWKRRLKIIKICSLMFTPPHTSGDSKATMSDEEPSATIFCGCKLSVQHITQILKLTSWTCQMPVHVLIRPSPLAWLHSLRTTFHPCPCQFKSFNPLWTGKKWGQKKHSYKAGSKYCIKFRGNCTTADHTNTLTHSKKILFMWKYKKRKQPPEKERAASPAMPCQQSGCGLDIPDKSGGG